MVSLAGPFTDFIGVTVPAERYEKCLAELRELLCAMGMRDEQEWGGYLGERGTFKHGLRWQVGTFGLSGDACAELRSVSVFDAWGQYLTILGEGAHRVTRLDAALDVPVDGARVVRDVYGRARRGRITLTRKAVPPHQVRKYSGRSLYGGPDTGTVNVGSRKRDVWARVYDKRQELLQRVCDAHGGLTGDLVALNDPGPLTRYELVIGRHVGASLHDAYSPAAVFWRFAGESLLTTPADQLELAAAWAPHGSGFAVPRNREPDYARQLSLLVDTSHDIKRAVTLADRLGPHGRTHLGVLLAKLSSSDERGVVPA